MNRLFEFTFEYIRSKVFGPKDYFERSKKRLVRATILPIIVIAGAPSLILGLLAGFRFISFEGWGASLRLIGEASSDLLFVSGSLVVTFFFAVGLNLIYGLRLKNLETSLQELRRSVAKEEACSKLVEEYFSLRAAGKVEEALSVGAFISKAYPDFIALQPDFVAQIIKDGARVEFLSSVPSSPQTRLILPESSQNGKLIQKPDDREP